MARFLAVQLARIGDLAQTRRLLAGLWRQAEKTGGEVHLAVDVSLVALARRLYPYAVVHGLPAHGAPGEAGMAAAAARVREAHPAFAALAAPALSTRAGG